MAMRVLLVDDEPSVLMAISRNLHFQIDITTAHSAEEAGALLGGPGVFDVVVTDIHMPGGSGLDFIESVSQSKPSTRFVVLTGSADPAVREAAERMPSVHRVLEKPASLAELVGALEGAVTAVNPHAMGT